MRVFRQTTTKNGRRTKSAKWYVEFKDRHERTKRIPGIKDKAATVEYGRRLERLVALRTLRQPDDPDTAAWVTRLASADRKRLAKIGLLDPHAVAHAKPLADHVTDYAARLRHNGRTEHHVKPTEARIRAVCDGCEFTFVSDVTPSRVEAFLAELKESGRAPGTVNAYLRSLKAFTKWPVSDGRTTENRLAHVKPLNATTDVRRERRELSDDELARLLGATRQGTTRHGLTGVQRFTLYATALGTGLRASELASITPAHLDLAADPPTVRIDAKDGKARRGDTLPMPADLATLLGEYVEGMDDDERLWPGTWAARRHGSKMMRHDLDAARMSWPNEDGIAESERTARERNDIIRHATDEGQRTSTPFDTRS